jgi:hypothetical protein
MADRGQKPSAYCNGCGKQSIGVADKDCDAYYYATSAS